jgi:glutaminyl-tRNA synthetase
MNLEYTIVSKRKLMRLVNEGHVEGWGDPRMPTLAGMRRRGIPPEAIVRFTESVGVAKVNNRVDLAKLEYTVRDHLNMTVPRVMGVLRPLKVVITNYPEGEGEELEVPSYPHDVPLEGSRMVPFSREIYIEADDFMEDPPKGFYRLAPGREVRLRYAYFIRCDEVVKDPDTGEVVELRCSYDPNTKGGNAPDGRKVKGTIQWVSAVHGLPAEVRLYDRLFTAPDPEAEEGRDFSEFLNPESKVVLGGAFVEPSVAADPAGTRYQFERQGYFMTDEVDSGPGALVFNRIVTLRDTWGRRLVADSGEIEEKRSAADSGEGKVKGSAAASREDKRKRRATDSTVADGTGSEGQAKEHVSDETSPTPKTRRERRNTAKESRERARAKHPELAYRYINYQEELGLSEEDADLLAGSMDLSDFFEATLNAAAKAPGKGAADPSVLANWIVNDLVRELKDRPLSSLPVTPEQLAVLVALREQDVISQPVAKEIFGEMVRDGVDPRALVEEQGLEKLSDMEAIKSVVDKVLAANQDKAQEYRDGKKGLMGFFMGQIMRETQGKADPKAVQLLIRQELGD